MGKKLTNAEVKDLKRMALQGITPADIGKNLGCAISTVHYYKDKFRKEEGTKFPAVKGKRPSETLHQVPSFSRPIRGFDKGGGKDIVEAKAIVNHAIKFVVNGVSVHVDPGVKSIEIQDNTIHINF